MKQRNQGRRRIHMRHDLRGLPDTMLTLPRLTIRREGIKRNPRERTAASLPLTAAQQSVLALLTGEPQRAAALAPPLNRTCSGVTSTLYALADRGLAERVPSKGWRRA